MKRNAILIAGIMFVAGTTQAQQASQDPYDSSSSYKTGSSAVTSTETVERDATSAVLPPQSIDSDSSQSYSSDSGSYGTSVSGSSSGKNYDPDSDEEFQINDSERDIDAQAEYSDHESSAKADSSIRGGSVAARGYDREANNDELEGAPDPLNPGEQADSSIRGGSIYAREREWNHDAEPSSGRVDRDRHLKADSSIRGGSIEARGGRELRGYGEDYQSSSGDSLNHDLDLSTETHDDFGQGSSAQWESNKADGSIRGSANWNPSDDLMRDGLGTEEDFEVNNDASLEGAVRSDVREGRATHEDLELNESAFGSAAESESGSSLSIHSDLNSSENLEENISGEFELENDSISFDSSTDLNVNTIDPNSTDSRNSFSSQASTDIWHDEADLSTVESELSSDAEMEMEAAGTAAGSEVGEESSSSDESSDSALDSSFQSNDPALNTFQQPTTSGDDLDFEYRDNRAHGVGSLATGEFGAAAAAQSGTSASMSDEEMARQIKARLTRESTGTHGLMRHEVARNIEVKANDGKVTLTGTVPSESDKQMIEVRVAEFANVEEVDNQITVVPEADPANRDLGLGHDLEDRTSDLQD